MFKEKLKPFVPEWGKKMYRLLRGFCAELKTVRILVPAHKCRTLFLPGFEPAGADRVFYPSESRRGRMADEKIGV